MRGKMAVATLLFVVAQLASIASHADVWGDIGKIVTDRKTAENKTDARLIRPTADFLPTRETPKCGDYDVAFRFSIAISGNQNFLYVFDPGTTLYALAKEWRDNAKALNAADYPDDATSGWSLANAITALDAIVKKIEDLKHETAIFSDYLRMPGTYPEESALLKTFRVNHAPALGYLGFDPGNLASLASLLNQRGLLHPLKVRGIGDMTLNDLYNTPALSEEMAGVGKPFIHDSTVEIVRMAQEIGLLQVPASCNAPAMDADATKSHYERYSLIPYCCCNNINHVGYYRTCTIMGTGTSACNICGSACCLAGVAWCISNHNMH